MAAPAIAGGGPGAGIALASPESAAGAAGAGAPADSFCYQTRERVHSRKTNVEKGVRERATKAKRPRQPRMLRVGNLRVRSRNPRAGE